MPQAAVGESPLRFGPRQGTGYPFEMNLRTEELFKDGRTMRLRRQPFQVLTLLVKRVDDIVSHDEIVSHVWAKDVFVGDPEQRVSGFIRDIRLALDDHAKRPQYVETRQGLGFRFIGRVEPPGKAALGAVREAVTEPGPIRSIAVLPFKNATGDPSQEYFVDGMTDLLTARLAQIPGLSVTLPLHQILRVTSFTSAMVYKNASKPLPQIARELGVDGIIEGSVLRSLNFIRITAQLIDCRTDRHVWAEIYTRTIEDVWALQGEVALNIANKIQLHLFRDGDVKRLVKRSVKPEALEAYLKGRFFWNKRTELDLGRALDYFRQAILEEPAYAEAHTGIADCYNMLAWNSMRPPKQVLPRARTAALEALRIDDQLAEAHSSLAFDLLFQDWDWKGAENEFRRSIELSPNYGVVRPWLAFELAALGREEEATTEVHRAVQIDPVASPILVSAALVYYLARQFDRAIKLCEDVLQMDPHGFYQAYFILGVAREGKGLHAEAIQALQACVSKSNRNAHMLAALGYCLARAGRASDAMEIIEELQRIYAPLYMAPFNFAMVCAGLGKRDETLYWLEKAYEDHSMWLTFVNAYPIFDFLRPEQKFQGLVRRMGFHS